MLAEALTKFTCKFSERSDYIAPGSLFITRYFASKFLGPLQVLSKIFDFCFSISPSNEYSGLISFMIDWLDLLAVQGTLKSLLHTTIRKHQFFGIQPSLQSNSHIHHDYWKTIALTIQTFVSKVMALLFNKKKR